MPFQAVVVGHTGATGSKLVTELLNRGWSVTCVGRQASVDARARSVVVADLLQVSSSTRAEDWTCDWFFNCIGTTRAIAGSGEAFLRIEKDMSVETNKMAKAAGVRHASVVSAQSSSASAPQWLWFHPVLYAHAMHAKEEASTSQGFASVTVFRPGMLDREKSDRGHSAMLNLLGNVLGALPVSTLARAMAVDAEAKLSSSPSGAAMEKVTYVSGNPSISALAQRLS